jgi:DNA-binding NarL/FixJ family response regulator
MSTRVLLAEGHWLMRHGLRSALDEDGQMDVVAEAADAHEAVRRNAEQAPDVVLLDLRLPGGDGLGVARLIAQSGPVRVLVMAERGDAVPLRDVLAAGCMGLLRKDLSRQELLEAMRCVLAGRVFLDADAARQLAQPAPAPMPCPVERLSPRERAVYLMVADGHTNRSMGQTLGLSTKTVEKHRAAVMTKLRLRSALDLRLMSLEHNLGGRAPAPPNGPRGCGRVASAAEPVPVCRHAGCDPLCGADFRVGAISDSDGAAASDS